MDNTGINIKNIDSLLRGYLLEFPDKKEVQQVITIQHEYILNANIADLPLNKVDYKLIDKLAKSTNYPAINKQKGIFLLLTFTVILIILICLFSFINSSSKDRSSNHAATHSSVICNNSITDQSIESNLPENTNFAKGSASSDSLSKNSSVLPSSAHGGAFIKYANDYMTLKLPFMHAEENEQDSIYLNLSFEEKTPYTLLPELWYAGGSGANTSCTVEIDSSTSYAGKYAMKIQRFANKENDSEYAILTNSIPLSVFRNKSSVAVSAYIKTENVDKGYAMLWCSQWDGKQDYALHYTNTYKQFDASASGWKQYTLELPIDTIAQSITFGAVVKSNGTVWVDKFDVMLDGLSLVDTKPKVNAPQANQIKWINQNSIPIKYFEPNSGFSDIYSMGNMIGDAGIVALTGYCLSSENNKLKNRISEYLVSEKGFSIIAIEAGMAEVSMINKYILSAKKDTAFIKDSLLPLLEWHWNSKEIAALIQWAQEKNTSSAGKIYFYGFGCGNRAIQELKTFALLKDPQLLKKIISFEKSRLKILDEKKKILRKYESLHPYYYNNFLKKLIQKQNEIAEFFTLRKADYLKLITPEQYAWYEHLIVLIKQNCKNDLSNYNKDLYSDYAANINWIISQNPDSKIILWTLNENMKNQEYGLGTNFDEDIKKKIKVIGFSSANGNFTSIKDSVVCTKKLIPPYQGTFENYLSQCSNSNFVFDMQNADSTNIDGMWLFEDTYIRLLYNANYPKQYYKRTPSEWYDIIVFTKEANPSANFLLGKKIEK